MAHDSARSVHEELPLHGAWMRRLARSLVRDEARAEDLTQEAALSALSTPAAAREKLAPWLARVVRNAARKDWRGEARRRARERAAARPEGLPAVDEDLARLDEQRRLVEALAALDAPVRRVVVRRYLDGWSCARIARETGEPAATVRGRLQRGLAELRARLDRDAGGDGVSWRLALLPLCGRGAPWPTPWELLRDGATTTSGVLTMKAGMQAAAVALVMAALGVGVWISSGGERGERARGAGETRVELQAAAPEPAAEVVTAPSAPEALRTRPEEAPERPAEPGPAPEVELVTRVRGRCLDSALVPLGKVLVTQRDPEQAPRAHSAADGRFELAVTPARSGEGLLAFELDGKATLFLPVTLASGTTEELGDVVLEAGGELHGLVLGPDQRPFEGADVTVTAPGVYGSREEAEARGPLERLLTAVSGRDGRFVVHGVPLTPVRAWAVAPGMRHVFSPPLRLASEREELVLMLAPLRASDRIRGIVLSPEGEPVPHAPLAITARSGGGMSMYDEAAGADGRFELETEPGTAYDLGASDPRWADVERAGVEPGTLDVELRFLPAVQVALEVRAAGKPLESFLAAAMRPDARSTLDGLGLGESHPEGRASVLVPGHEFVVQVDARGYRPELRGPFAPDAPPGLLTFELEPAPDVRGRVLSGGHPLAGARVGLHRATPDLYVQAQGFEASRNPWAEDRTTTDAEGRFVLKLREADTYVVRAEAEGHAPVDSGPLALHPARGAELELVLGRGGALEGRVRLRDGRDPEGLIVALNRADGFPRTLRADAEGRFRFEGLTPGEWQLSRAKREFNPNQHGGAYATRAGWTLPTNCVVVEGETTYMDLDLRDWEPGELEGRLTLDGSPAHDWLVEAWPDGVRAFSGELPRTALDAEGRFRFVLDELGPRRLHFTPAPELGLDGQILLVVPVEGGRNDWSHDLRTGALSGRCSPLRAGESLLLTSPPGAVPSFWFSIRPDLDDRFFVFGVPAGRAEIRRHSGEPGREPELLGELTIEPGVERSFDLP